MVALKYKRWLLIAELRQQTALFIIPAAQAELATHAACRGAIVFTDAVLQVGDIFVNVHRGRHTAIRDIFVVVRTGFAIHCIHTRDGDILVASGDVPVEKLLYWASLVSVSFSLLFAGMKGVPNLRVLAAALHGRLSLFVLEAYVSTPRQKQVHTVEPALP